MTVQGADRRRFEYLDPGPVVEGAAPRATRVFDRDRGWHVKADGSVTEFAPVTVALDREDTALDAALVNLAPLRDPSAQVERAGGEEVDGRPAVGLRVARPGGGTLTTYFDKESGLPVKGVARWPAPDGGRDTAHTTTCREFKEFGGLKVATRRVSTNDTGGVRRVSVVTDVVGFRLLDRVDPKTFAKPE